MGLSTAPGIGMMGSKKTPDFPYLSGTSGVSGGGAGVDMIDSKKIPDFPDPNGTSGGSGGGGGVDLGNEK